MSGKSAENLTPNMETRAKQDTLHDIWKLSRSSNCCFVEVQLSGKLPDIISRVFIDGILHSLDVLSGAGGT